MSNSSLTIKTNNQFRELLYWHELTEKEQTEFDYDGAEDSTFFRYKGYTYTLCDFMRVEREGPFKGWDGILSDSFFSGVLVKFSDDGDAVKVATYYS